MMVLIYVVAYWKTTNNSGNGLQRNVLLMYVNLLSDAN